LLKCLGNQPIKLVCADTHWKKWSWKKWTTTTTSIILNIYIYIYI
jgi:hypothetical protein